VPLRIHPNKVQQELIKTNSEKVGFNLGFNSTRVGFNLSRKFGEIFKVRFNSTRVGFNLR